MQSCACTAGLKSIIPSVMKASMHLALLMILHGAWNPAESLICIAKALLVINTSNDKQLIDVLN